MKILNKIKPVWKFSQKGNLWKFIFAGEKYIVGETRDIANKCLYLFAINISNGKKILSDFKFENGNYWVSLDYANETSIFLSRFENPELPYPKDIIALDILTGRKKWEINEYIMYFCTNDILYGMKRKYDKVEYAEIDLGTGEIIKIIPETQNSMIQELKLESDADLFSEFYDYPKPLSKHPTKNVYDDIFKLETTGKEIKGDIEYVLKNGKLFFNYYVKIKPDLSDLTVYNYKNIFCIYDADKRVKLFEEVLNERSTYNVPDNFFSRGDYLYYLVEKKELKAIKIL